MSRLCSNSDVTRYPLNPQANSGLTDEFRGWKELYNPSKSTQLARRCALFLIIVGMHRMDISSFPSQISLVLKELMNEKETEEIWFIGSRANGNERSDSDWDFIVFAHEELHERSIRDTDIDIVRVNQNNQYLLEGENLNMSGSFENWNWRKTSEEKALYTNRIVPDTDEGEGFNDSDVRYPDLKGIKIWCKNA